MHTPEGQLIVALSEHVTYWDRLGWKDSFSDSIFTARQNGYGYRFTLDSVYTPQMIVNGTTQFVGGNRKALVDALHAEAPRGRIDLRIVSVEPLEPSPAAHDDALSSSHQTSSHAVLPTVLTVRFSAQNVSGTAPLDVMAAITDDLDETKVLRGENGGRTLTHASVARSLTRVGEIRGNTANAVRVALPASVQQSPDKPHHLVLFVQQHNFGRIVGADTKPLRLAATP